MLDIEAIRGVLPALGSVSYLNTGTAGPLPAPVAEAMRLAVTEDERHGRASGKRYARIDQIFETARGHFAALLGVETAQVGLTSGTVDGLAIALDALGLEPGGTVLTTSIEHPAALAALARTRARYGIRTDTVEISESDTDQSILERFVDAMTAPIRAVLVSDVAYATGRRMPLSRIAICSCCNIRWRWNWTYS